MTVQINYLGNDIKRVLIDKNIKVYIANLDELNEKYSLHGKINNVICMYMLKICEYSNEEINDFKKLVKKA